MTVLFLLALLVFFPGFLCAESGAVETARIAVVSAVTNNWICAPDAMPPGGCHGTDPGTAGFIGAHGIKLNKFAGGTMTSKLFLYVHGGAGVSAGPGSECGGRDVITIFEMPWSHAGVRGAAGVTYRGLAHPCDQQHWANRQVFRDDRRGAIYMTASRSMTGANNDFKDIYLGESPMSLMRGGEDNGVTFTWTPFLHVGSMSFGIQDVHLQPHPTQPGIWFGIASVAGKGSTLVKVDWNVGTITMGRATSPASWITIPIGGTITTQPAIAWPHRATGLAPVAGGRYEVWTTLTTPRSGNHPCASKTPPPAYVTNTTGPGQGNLARGSAGNDLAYTTMTPDLALGPTYPVSSNVRPLPSDHNAAALLPGRIDVPTNGVSSPGLYYGTLDNVICSYDLADWNPWSGAEIVFSTIGYLP